jgi:stage IV sporulation protein A
MVPGAMGAQENEKPRMVKSPWFDEAIPFDEAAEIGTRKVICEHSTVGLVITTDGSISDIPRTGYEQAEARVIAELERIHKPFVILLNCVAPDTPAAQALAEELSRTYGHTVLPISCVDLTEEDITEILKHVLYEFPLREVAFAMPRWVTLLEHGHWLQEELYAAVRTFAQGAVTMRDIAQGSHTVESAYLKSSHIRAIDLGTGCVTVNLELADGIFYRVLGETTGLDVCDEAGLMPCIIELAKIKKQYEKIESALAEVQATGYGIVMPTLDELRLEEPEIMRQGGRYGVRLRASAPSIHMLRADIATEVAPIVGSEKQSEDLVNSLLANFSEDPIKIWESNIFGKSLHELVNEGLQSKLMHMPPEARARLQETLERVINEGCSGLICIIL